MAEQKKIIQLPLWAQILVGVIVATIIISIALNMPKEKDLGMNIQEAQIKCMLMNEWGQVNEIGKPFSQEVVEEAERFCLSQWDSPEREKDFLNSTPKDWEVMKGKELNGHTLQEIYDEQQRLEETP